MLNDPVKIAAVAGGAMLLLWPYLQPLLTNAIASIRSSFQKKADERGPIGVDDMTTVLRLANKLRIEGNAKGVELAQQLLDAMMSFTPKR